MRNIAIFASGSGTNAENITRYFSNHPQIKVSLILTNNPKAGVIKRAEVLGIPCSVFNRASFYQTDEIVSILGTYNIDLIVLAGFLWLVPQNILKAYPDKMINIHPALLPKYGGKGMFGQHVHEAVIKNGEKISGITIHYVNESYDEGQIILKKEVSVSKTDTAESLAKKIHELEYKYFPPAIEKLLI